MSPRKKNCSRCLIAAAAFLLVLAGRPQKAAHACSFFLCNYDANQPDNGTTLEKANYYNQFRGPDATNVQHIHGWTFLHNLLSMTGNFTLQPFVNKDESVVALFNGEVYNYRDLAVQLENGDADAYASDGFALLPAYRKWGTHFVEHLHGEYAIVLVDFVKGVVILSTDVFSTKPLWYGIWPCSNKKVCFAAASYQSVLEGVGVPKGNRVMADANEVLVLSLSNAFAIESRRPVFTFDLHQHKNTTEDWGKAFMHAVKVRSERVKHKMFIGLSAGFDSGSIMLALELLQRPFYAYNIVTQGDSGRVIDDRVKFCQHAEATLIKISEEAFQGETAWLKKHCEKFEYSIHNVRKKYILPAGDKAAMGLSYILKKVRDRGGLIYLSGSGADETINDYGLKGKKIFPHSCFAGVFPANLSTIFPWCSFYGGTQRAYLMKEELVGGAHGIESRYPFLDPYVVQENLWLTHTLKNSEYKRPVADFLRKHSFPNMWGRKAGFNPKRGASLVENHRSRPTENATKSAPALPAFPASNSVKEAMDKSTPSNFSQFIESQKASNKSSLLASRKQDMSATVLQPIQNILSKQLLLLLIGLLLAALACMSRKRSDLCHYLSFR